jgi:uncharacterized MAPEG superfamily protein
MHSFAISPLSTLVLVALAVAAPAYGELTRDTQGPRDFCTEPPNQIPRNMGQQNVDEAFEASHLRACVD